MVLRNVLIAWLVMAGPILAADPPSPFRLAWDGNMLTISGPSIPGGALQVWYLEAFCRSDSTAQPWEKTTIPHKTELLRSSPDGKQIRLRTTVEPGVVIDHRITAGKDSIDFQVRLRNTGREFSDVQWFQPCMRVDRFTGLKQDDYIKRSFIFTQTGFVTLNTTVRRQEALYRGGQVYVPPGIDPKDVNPRPISPEPPVNGLIGALSEDGKSLVAMAWDHTQELFQGVIVCLHNDPHVGGLKPGEEKTLRGKIYFLPNDPALLLERYRKDFGVK